MDLLADVDIIQGDSYEWTFSFQDKDAQNNLTPRNISGMTLTFAMKRTWRDSDSAAYLLVSTTFPNDASSIAGLGTIFVPYTATAQLPIHLSSEIVYSFRLSYVDGEGRTQSKTVGKGLKRPLPSAVHEPSLP